MSIKFKVNFGSFLTNRDKELILSSNVPVFMILDVQRKSLFFEISPSKL